MNTVDLLIIIFALLSIVVGVKRGFLVSVLGVARIAAAVPLSLYVGNSYSELIYKNYVREYVYGIILSKLDSSNEIADISNGINELVGKFSAFTGSGGTGNSFDLPDNSSAAAYLTDTVLQSTLLEIVKILLIVLTFLIFYVITGIIISAVRKAKSKKKIPLHRTDSFFGGVFGFIKACAYLLVFSAISDFVITLADNEGVLANQLSGSEIIAYINNINPLV